MRCSSGSRAALKHLVVVRAAEPALGLELHILYTARGAGQPRQFIRQLADVLADDRLQDRGQVQFLLLEDFLLLGAFLAQMDSFFWPLTMSVK